MRNPAKDNPDKMTISKAKAILPIDLQDLKLSTREFKFVAEYVTNGFNQQQAAIQAGYNLPNSTRASNWGYQLTHKPHIVEAIRRFMEMVIAPYRDRLEYEVMDRYYRRATYDVLTFLNPDGTIRPIDTIPAEWRQCIDGVERRRYGTDGYHVETTYKLPDRDTALQMLYKFVTGFDPDDKGKGNLPSEARARMQTILRKYSNGDTSLTFKMGVDQRTGKPTKKTGPKPKIMGE